MGWDGVYDQDVEVARLLFRLPRPDELLRELFASTLVARVLASLLFPCVFLYLTPQLWLRVLRRRSGLREIRLFAGGIHYAALEKGGVEGSSTVLFLHDQLTDKDVWHDVCSKFDPERFHLLGSRLGNTHRGSKLPPSACSRSRLSTPLPPTITTTTNQHHHHHTHTYHSSRPARLRSDRHRGERLLP